MIAFAPTIFYRYYVEFIDDNSQWEGVKHRAIYMYATSELNVKEILKEYRVTLIDKTD